MSKPFTFIALVVLTALPILQSRAEDSKVPKESGDPVPILFVQSAKEVSFEDGRITLKGVNPATIFFSDRPERLTGNLPTSQFLNVWNEGKDSFKNDPPNANLSILGEKEGITNVVVELSNPRLDDDELTYDIKILEGVMPESGGASSLFIDWFVAYGHRYPFYRPYPVPPPVRPYPGPRVVCTRNWYTGRSWCHTVGPY